MIKHATKSLLIFLRKWGGRLNKFISLKTWLLAVSNIRKGKGQATSFFIMILLAAILMNLGLVTWFKYDSNFDRKGEQLNTAHSLIAVQSTDPELIDSIKKELTQDSRTSELETESILFTNVSFLYGSGSQTQPIAILNSSHTRKVGNISFVEKAEVIDDNSIYLPYLYQTGGGYELGDSFVLTLETKQGQKEVSYTVAGFYEETFLGSTNVGIISVMLEEESFNKLDDYLNSTCIGTLFKMRITNFLENQNYTTEHYSALSSPLLQDIPSSALYYDIVKQARTMTSSIGSIIVMIFSIIIVAISLVVVKFRIGNSIEEDMQNIGALKAIGYTSKQVVRSILLQFLLIGLLGCLFGILLSYVVLPLMANAYAAQTGVLWKPEFDLFSFLLTITIILIMITMTSLLSTRRIKYLHPIIALRNGLSTHTFKKNHFPLERYKRSLTFSISGKLILQNFNQNITILFIIAVISFASVFACTMYYNIGSKDSDFLEKISGEVTDIQLTLNEEGYTANILKTVTDMPSVEKATYYDSVNAYCSDIYLLCYISEDFSQLNNQKMCYEGRYPIYENEIVIHGKMAKELNKNIGDTISISLGTIKKEYLITGFLQSSNFMGHDSCLTSDGYRMLMPEYQPKNIFVYLQDGISSTKFIDEIDALQKSEILSITEMRKFIKGQLGVYKSIVTIIVTVILLVMAAVIALVLYLIIKTTLTRKKQMLGIQKAIGFTTGQLMLQTIFSFFPVVFLGTIIGILSGYVGVNPLVNILFQDIGVIDADFIILPTILLLLGIAINFLAFAITAWVSYRIRKVTPYALMN